MGDIRFGCPQCGAHLLADKADAGGQADCPKCAASVVIPGGPPPPPKPPEKQLFLYKDGQQMGPYPMSQITQMLSQNQIAQTDWAWTEGMTTWESLSTISGIPLPPPKPPRPPSPPQAMPKHELANLFQKADSPESSAIESLEVSESWKEKFMLIEEAGGFNGLNVRNSQALSFRERFKLTFNIGGLLLGPFYYILKGMWAKGTIYLALVVAFTALRFLYDVPFVHYLILPLQFLPANLATGDYYLWKVEKKQLW